MNLLKILKTSDTINLENFPHKDGYKDLVAEVNELIKSKSLKELVVSDSIFRRNLTELLSQLYFHYYLQALNATTSSTKATKMKKVFGPSILSFFTHLREIDEKNLLYR